MGGHVSKYITFSTVALYADLAARCRHNTAIVGKLDELGHQTPILTKSPYVENEQFYSAMPRGLPKLHVARLPSMDTDMDSPRRWASTGRQGTSTKPKPSSSMA